MKHSRTVNSAGLLPLFPMCGKAAKDIPKNVLANGLCFVYNTLIVPGGELAAPCTYNPLQ